MRAQFYTVIFIFAIPALWRCAGQRTSPEKTTGHVNRLANSGSPYLQEHADNPVDWYEWGDEAFNRAKTENKPVIISIGYSSCHWCHVMEDESFMDSTVARFMNENFICIKIDREQRPDVDQIYIHAAELLSGNAGWPLNAFALADGKPFYATTYVARDQWISLLQRISAAYADQHDNVLKQADVITKQIREQDSILLSANTNTKLGKTNYNDLFDKWAPYLDFRQGGLTGSLKFPMPVDWEFLLQYHYLTGNEKALEVVTTTLDGMAMGGIFDQLGGGFSRYSTDAAWQIPHFEKMLYDNAQLVSLYAHAYQQTQKPLYRQVLTKTLQFVADELTSPEGGFYSSINADSEGEEGKFYVWTEQEIRSRLDGDIAEYIIDYYQIATEGNWENGKNVLYCEMAKEDFAAQNKIDVNKLIAAENQLLQERNKRRKPSRDDKIITSWNALMLKAYIDAYFATGEGRYLLTAKRNAAFLEKTMVGNGYQLRRDYSSASVAAFLDDYALLASAYISLYEATFEIHWLELARLLTDYAMTHFRDGNSPMFYYTANEAEPLVARKVQLNDNVIASANSVMAEVIFRLGHYFDEPRYIAVSEEMLALVSEKIFEQPPFYASWSFLMGLVTHQPFQVAIAGSRSLEKNVQLRQHYLPLSIFMGGEHENLPLLENKLLTGKTIIYVCRNKICKLPVQEADDALEQLRIR